MKDFIFLMHGDGAPDGAPDGNGDWDAYLARLRAQGRFEGGSEIGDGACYRKTGVVPPVSGQITGFIRVSARDLGDAASLLPGNPAYEAGATIEIRELPRS